MWLWLLTACVLGPRPDSCEINSDCRDAFGFGSVCGEDGYCDALVVDPRCDTTFPVDLFQRPENYADHLVIGSIFNMPLDEKQRLSAELAVRNVNDAQEASDAYGRGVAIVHCDNAENPDYDNLKTVPAAVASATFLTDVLGVQAIIGPSTSDESLAVVDAVSPAGAITISPSATSPTLTPLGREDGDPSGDLFWRTVPPDDLQAFAISQDLRDRGVPSIYILHESSSYAASLAEAVQGNFEGSGRTVKTSSYQVGDGTGLVLETSKAFDDAAEEIVFFTGESADVVRFLDAAVAADPAFVGRSIFLADAAADSALFDAGAGAQMFPFIRGTRPQVPDGPVFGDFVTLYSIEYDDTPADSVFTSYAYDAAWLALYGAMWAEANGEPTTGASIRSGILDISSGTSYDIGYLTVAQVRQAMERGETVDIAGASGPLNFDLVNGEVSNPIEVWIVDEVGEDFTPVKVCQPGGACEDIPQGTTTSR